MDLWALSRLVRDPRVPLRCLRALGRGAIVPISSSSTDLSLSASRALRTLSKVICPASAPAVNNTVRLKGAVEGATGYRDMHSLCLGGPSGNPPSIKFPVKLGKLPGAFPQLRRREPSLQLQGWAAL